MFIVIESIDAGGGSTQTALLADHLKQQAYSVLDLHFPQADQPTGQFIYRKFLNTKNQPKFSRREQALLYISDFYSRARDIQEHSGQVVSDRWYTSTLAYQTINLSGQTRTKLLTWLLDLCSDLPQPDLVFLLDTPVSLSLERLHGTTTDYFENKQKLTSIRRSYLRIANEQNWQIIDCLDDNRQQKTKQALHQEIWEKVTSQLN